MRVYYESTETKVLFGLSATVFIILLKFNTAEIVVSYVYTFCLL